MTGPPPVRCGDQPSSTQDWFADRTLSAGGSGATPLLLVATVIGYLHQIIHVSISSKSKKMKFSLFRSASGILLSYCLTILAVFVHLFFVLPFFASLFT
jgi:hypothetical protein